MQLLSRKLTTQEEAVQTLDYSLEEKTQSSYDYSSIAFFNLQELIQLGNEDWNF